jgi:CheY-like chemotaxis protein
MSTETTAARDRAILIVDDEPLILIALRRELRSGLGASYLYETATDGESGLRAVEELVADGVMVALVVSDWLMPGMKGDEFLMILRSRYPSIRTIMMTGQADESQVERIRTAGALDAFFLKPWNALRFSETCKSLLGMTA